MNTSPTFVASIFDLSKLPSDGLPEIALVGRSNVGKSSLINALAERKGLAKTSSTPGKTRSLNYYRFPKGYYLVDTPGYGYAAQSKAERQRWRQLMDDYILRPVIRSVGLVIDMRHPGLQNDVAALEWLLSLPLSSFIVLTKSDKVTQKEIATHEKYLRSGFSGVDSLFCVSSTNGKGIAKLRTYLNRVRLGA